MKTTILVAAIWMAGAAPALAQDWTGGYLAGHIGFSRIPEGANDNVVFDRDLDGDFDDLITTAAGANAFSPGFCTGAATTALPSGGCVQDDTGIDAGGRGGYDWQTGRIVFGLVGEFAFVDHVDSVTAFSTTPANYVFTRELDWVGGVRARAGGGFDRVLIYGTGGLAWGSVDHTFTSTNTVNTFVEDEDSMALGYQVGGGIEFRFGGNWTAGAEYLWTMLADADRYTVRAGGPAPATNPFILGNAAGSDLRRTDDFEFGAIRFGVGYRF
jgi:outer membrane immunogenic protein